MCFFQISKKIGNVLCIFWNAVFFETVDSTYNYLKNDRRGIALYMGLKQGVCLIKKKKESHTIHAKENKEFQQHSTAF